MLYRQYLGILFEGHALFFPRYESCIDAEIQQRAVEYFALSRKGAALMDIMAEMPKFSERQVHVYSICMQSDSVYSVG